MKWYNKPLKSVENANSITMTVDPGTDYWRITHYDFIRDNGPF
jgi:regulation of enolase protein 1 (concanavalin A-like superfamily)